MPEPAVRCAACADTGHVCENHPGMPWGGLCCDDAALRDINCDHGACGCGGAGMPCPQCCSPIPENPRVSILVAFTPDWMRASGLTPDWMRQG